MKNIKPYYVEACVVTLDQAIRAAQNGANRLEVCERLETGGMTPDFNLVSHICDSVKIPVRVMIRASAEGFESDQKILEEMITSILAFSNLPIDGFVFGLLKNNRVDREAMDLLLEHTSTLPVTFHKAIDLSSDLESDLKWMNKIQAIDTVLTSGGAESVFDGFEEILKMKSVFEKDIMAGGKIKPEQLPEIHEKLMVRWYHGRSIVVDSN